MLLSTRPLRRNRERLLLRAGDSPEVRVDYRRIEWPNDKYLQLLIVCIIKLNNRVFVLSSAAAAAVAPEVRARSRSNGRFF